MSDKEKGPHVSRHGGQEKNLKQTDKLNLTPPHSFVNIPEELKKLDQWVCWKKINQQGKIKKIPIDSSTGRPAATNDPRTWGKLERAIKYYEAHKNDGIEGVGFVFTSTDPHCGIDIDNCRNPDTGELTPTAQDIVNHHHGRRSARNPKSKYTVRIAISLSPAMFSMDTTKFKNAR